MTDNYSTNDTDHPVSPSPFPNVVSDSASLRILLWDIDGTLMRTVEAGSYKDYFVPMLERVFQTSGCLPELHVSGMTDLQIVAEALRDEGFTMERINQRLDDLRTCYMEEMRRVAGNGSHSFNCYPARVRCCRRLPIILVTIQVC